MLSKKNIGKFDHPEVGVEQKRVLVCFQALLGYVVFVLPFCGINKSYLPNMNQPCMPNYWRALKLLLICWPVWLRPMLLIICCEIQCSEQTWCMRQDVCNNATLCPDNLPFIATQIQILNVSEKLQYVLTKWLKNNQTNKKTIMVHFLPLYKRLWSWMKTEKTHLIPLFSQLFYQTLYTDCPTFYNIPQLHYKL